LKKQLFWLRHSFDETIRIGLKQQYEIDEFDSFENLCSRFSRTVDFLIRKVFRAIDEVEFEVQGTLIDTVNRAHKRELFDEMETIRYIKDLRNASAHEYVDEALQDLFADILEMTPKLIDMVEKTLDYIQQYKTK
jgi:hypothetical protein